MINYYIQILANIHIKIIWKNTYEDIAKYSVLKENEQLFASKYKLYLPTEDELRAEIENQKTIFELQQQNKQDLDNNQFLQKIQKYSRQKSENIVKFKINKRQVTMQTMSPICRQIKNTYYKNKYNKDK